MTDAETIQHDIRVLEEEHDVLAMRARIHDAELSGLLNRCEEIRRNITMLKATLKLVIEKER
jgi:hypothetical protein